MSVQLPKTIHEPGSGGCASVFVAIFLVPMSIGAYRYATMEAGVAIPLAGGIVAGVLSLLLLGTYFFFNSEATFQIDALGLSVSRRSRLGPITGRSVVDIDVRWDRVGEVYDVTERRLTKHGSMNASYKLVIGKHTIRCAELGTMERDGKYLELIEAVRAAVGARLVTKEDLGDLEGPLKRLVDERVAKAGSEPGAGKG